MLAIAIILVYLACAMFTMVVWKCSGRGYDSGIDDIAIILWPITWVVFAIFTFCNGFETLADAIVKRICPNVKPQPQEKDECSGL